MLFERLKYVLPVWYFNLPPFKEVPYFIDVNKIKDPSVNTALDKRYKSSEFALVDKAYELFRAGYISNNAEEALKIDIPQFPAEDEYGFIRKYYGKLYIYYVFLIRIFSGASFLKELKGMSGTGKFNKIEPIQDFGRAGLKRYQLQERPLVTIILPTLNRYFYLENVLEDLEKQTYKNFEVVVLDQSDRYEPKFYRSFGDINIKPIHLKKKGVWNARNNGIKQAAGEVIVFTEDDVRLNSQWLENHMKCLEYFQCDISSGLLIDSESQLIKNKPVFKWSEQLPTGNVAIRKNVFKTTGLFDLQFEGQRMGDGEFGLRCYLDGFKNISNPAAYCVDIKADTGGFREFGSWDAYRTKNLLGPRPVPSVLYFYRKYFSRQNTFLALLKNIPPSVIPYKFKRNRKMLIAGSFTMIFLVPLVLFQVIISWKSASKKLKEGAKIEQL